MCAGAGARAKLQSQQQTARKFPTNRQDGLRTSPARQTPVPLSGGVCVCGVCIWPRRQPRRRTSLATYHRPHPPPRGARQRPVPPINHSLRGAACPALERPRETVWVGARRRRRAALSRGPCCARLSPTAASEPPQRPNRRAGSWRTCLSRLSSLSSKDDRRTPPPHGRRVRRAHRGGALRPARPRRPRRSRGSPESPTPGACGCTCETGSARKRRARVVCQSLRSARASSATRHWF